MRNNSSTSVKVFLLNEKNFYLVKEKLNISDCGDEDLNNFLLEDDLDYHNSFLVKTYCLSNVENGDLIAFYSVLNDKIIKKSFSSDDNKTGCKFITVDSYDNRVSFYENLGFKSYPKAYEKNKNTTALYLNFDQIA